MEKTFKNRNMVSSHGGNELAKHRPGVVQLLMLPPLDTIHRAFIRKDFHVYYIKWNVPIDNIKEICLLRTIFYYNIIKQYECPLSIKANNQIHLV